MTYIAPKFSGLPTGSNQVGAPTVATDRDLVRRLLGDRPLFDQPDRQASDLMYRRFAVLLRARGLQNGPSHEVEHLFGSFSECFESTDPGSALHSLMQPALGRAILDRNIGSARELVACGADLSEVAERFIARGDVERLRTAIEAGLKVGRDLLEYVIYHRLTDVPANARHDILRLLLQTGVSLDGDNRILVNLAVERHDPIATALLLDKGASPDGHPDFQHPLTTAIENNDGDAFDLLVRRGANVDGNGLAGKSPIAVAMRLNE